MLYAKRLGDAVLHRYNDLTFERFWKRELNIENPDVVGAVLKESGADARGFPAYLKEGREELDRICRDAETLGVFGVPSFIIDGELFWGREHLPDIRGMLGAPSREVETGFL
jgi:2-hydroxychromene-2-carboxylate isomerase